MTARILIAESSATSRISLKVRLSGACYDVLAAATVNELLSQLRLGHPDLILLGMGFTELPLADFFRMVSVERPRTPVLALADGQRRVDALEAGASAVLDPRVEEQMLLARVRGLLRDSETDAPQFAMAEAAGGFAPAPSGNVVLVADQPARAQRWRHILQPRLNCRFAISSPDETLSAAAQGDGADLYIIAADIDRKGDGLRLLSELRSRNGSKEAGFAVLVAPEREELCAIALDLGAGEVLPLDPAGENNAEIAALALRNQLDRKRRADSRREEVKRNMAWAMTDPLTGLYNRRYAVPQLVEIARGAMRQQSGFAVMALDLDRFKTINDNFGHAAGDAVLCDVARRVESVVAGRGMTARLGGEEFLVVLADTTETEAHRIAQDIRRAVETRPTLLPRVSGGGQVQVTLSVGVALEQAPFYISRPDVLAEIALERADRAMIAAKSLGRNQVLIAPMQPAH
ncbi:diguanylate cyclase [Paracoccus sediminis]|uniref:diguanylate cyclase n=1 Tax=Paracoccus sediminis TaxID=1214787 RepID=A0A238UTY1_9RHOB|nr:diguanylate cyclase [Paracoccus sediminis]TBN52808.1 diguanylate cyclase [Paracoccus sediminis]SNR25650.1 response regulator receiver modulated diguanylate cyclase [Paracoccus sediminis]